MARTARGRAAVTRYVTGSVSTFPAMVPPPQVDDAEGVVELERSIARIERDPDASRCSPSLGHLTAEEATALHLAHCEHHFGFLERGGGESQIAGRAG